MITNNGTFIGHGTDGVFRNLMAKPERDTTDNEVNPPTYLQASEDSVPQYWESSVISPMYEDEVFVQGLPVGNIANFIWNALVSIAFQFVGFVLCYLLHTSHAAKHGSRLGLGITFILQGYQMVPTHFTHATRLPAKIIVDRPNDIVVDKSMEITGSPFTYSAVDSFSPFSDTSLLSETVKTPIFAYSLIAFGIFLIFKSLIDYYRVKQLEKGILAPQFQSDTVNLTTEVLENVQD